MKKITNIVKKLLKKIINQKRKPMKPKVGSLNKMDKNFSWIKKKKKLKVPKSQVRGITTDLIEIKDY